MKSELGVKAAVRSFHRQLPADVMGCDLVTGLPATWIYTKSKRNIKVSGAAAEILIQSRRIKAEDLHLYKSKPFSVDVRRWDFVTSSMSVSMGFSYDIIASLGGFWRNPQRLHERNSRQRTLARVTSEASSTVDGDFGENSNKTLAKMVGASAMSIPHFAGVTVKGFLVDIPVAFTEGFRNTPKLYGEKVPDHAPVTDWKSGFKVAATTFAHQMAEGVTDIVVQPVKGAMEEGVIGFGVGLGKGSLQSFTKPAAGKSLLPIFSQAQAHLCRSVYRPHWLHWPRNVQVSLRRGPFQDEEVHCFCPARARQIFHPREWCGDCH